MYFEPSRKTYYRFPSNQSITELDSRRYFPEKPSHLAEDIRNHAPYDNHVTEREIYYDI